MLLSVSKFLVFAGMVILLLANSKCSKNKLSPDFRQENDHFVLFSDFDHSSQAEVDHILNQAEVLFSKISTIVGPARTPENKIKLLLEGPFTGQGPYFDSSGIHLFRYSEEENGYLALLTHEMVHAFREPYYIEKQIWTWPNYGYYDEAFAEYIAQLVDHEKTGFPFYGFPEHVVVGNMVINKNHLQHETLRNQHEEYNQPCNLQTYPQRASWLRHIDEIYGRAALFSIAYSETEPTSEVILSSLGTDLPTIDLQWEDWISNIYQQIEKADSIAQAYRAHTSWYSYCE